MTGAVTVAVVVKDRLAAMQRCLAALRALDPAPAALLVVDNGSSDGTRAWLAAQPDVTLVDAPGPLGRARQAAVDACGTPWLAFTDSDCAPEPGWVGALLAATSEGVDVVQGRTLPARPLTRRWSASQDIARFTDLYECCNLLYRVGTLRRAGGFSVTDGFFGEDTAAGWRVRRQGGRGVYAADAVVRHDTTTPGLLWHLRRALGYQAFPALVRQFPEMRTELLHRRVFLRPRSVPVVMAALGLLVALAGPRRLPALAALPWLWAHRPDRRGRAGLADAASGLLYDAAVLTGLLLGSVRHRRAVL